MVPIDIHEFEIPLSTLSSGKSNDSGLPGTPPLQEMLHLNSSNIPPPSEVVKSGMRPNHLRFRSISTEPVHSTSLTETAQMLKENRQGPRRVSDTDPQVINNFSKGNYVDIQKTNPPQRGRTEDCVQYSSIQLVSPVSDSPTRGKRLSEHKLEPVDENDGIYDTPNCEPPYWEITGNGVISPLITPLNNETDTANHLFALRKGMAQSSCSIYTPGSDLKERDEDFEDLPPIPSRVCRMKLARPPVKEPVQLVRKNSSRGRLRLYSTGDVLEAAHHYKTPNLGSMDNLTTTRRRESLDMLRDSRNDLLTKLHEQDEILSQVLARSRNERNEELGAVGEEGFNRPYKSSSQEDYDQELEQENNIYSSPTSSTYIRSGRSSASSDRGERFLTKVASDTVRGYAYKIQIPQSNCEYDVPRRAAPAPNLVNLRSDAPPKPLRYITSAES